MRRHDYISFGRPGFVLSERWWAEVDSNHIYLCRCASCRGTDESGMRSDGKRGVDIPGTNARVEFTYRLAKPVSL